MILQCMYYVWSQWENYTVVGCTKLVVLSTSVFMGLVWNLHSFLKTSNLAFMMYQELKYPLKYSAKQENLNKDY